jgi:hypothetical protein
MFSQYVEGAHWFETTRSRSPSPSTSAMAIPRLAASSPNPIAAAMFAK